MSLLGDLKNINFKSTEEHAKERNQNIFLGVLIGTAIGAMAAVFMQTDKGKEVLSKAKDLSKDISEKSKVVLYDSVNKIKTTKDKVVDKISNKPKEEYEENDGT